MHRLTLPRSGRTLFAAVMIVSLLLAGCATPTPTPTPAPEGVLVIDPAKTISNFNLTSHAGTEMRLTDLKGKYLLLTFGYTHCPDICPVTLAHFKSVKALLGEQADEVQFLFFSVDGARDTPEVLSAYLPMFDASFIGLTGDEVTMRNIIHEYGGEFYIRNAGGLKKDYPVEHSAGSYLLNREGQWVRRFSYGTDPEIVAADIRGILKG